VGKEEQDKLVFDLEAVFDPDDYLYFYEDVVSEKRTNKEVDLLITELKMDRPMRVLDLACGFGRHANRLAERGHKVTGVDITEGFLDIARAEAQNKNLDVTYLRGDMRDICFDGEFERALLLFTAFGYFEDEENYKVLQNVSRALVKGGLFCFDTINRDAYLKTFLSYSVVEKDNDLMVDMNSFDALTGRNYTKRIIIRNGVRKDAPYFVRFYNLTEIGDLLNRAGLTLCNVYENWDGKPFTSTSFRMIMVAKKE